MALWIAAALAFGALAPTGAAAQSAHEKIKPALVLVTATGERADGTEAHSQTTGFVVSSDGIVLTAYSLLTGLGDVKPESISIFGSVDGAAQLRATELDSDSRANLLLLKLSGKDSNFQKVALGQLATTGDDDRILFSGYSIANGYHSDSGQVTDRDTESPSLWSTDLSFEDGDTGAPIYDSAGTVIGIARGTPRKYIVPIEFAEAILAPVKIADMEASLAGILKDRDDPDHSPARIAMRLQTLEGSIRALQQQYNWDASFDAAAQTETAWLYYKAVLPGGIAPKEIRLKVTPLGDAQDGSRKIFETFEEQVIQPDTSFNRSLDYDGRFEIPEAAEDMKFFRDRHHLSRVVLRVDFVVVLMDETVLPPKRVFLEK